MKVGETGEAFFVFETDESVPESLQTSPLSGPVSDDGLDDGQDDLDNDDGTGQGGTRGGMEPLDLDAPAETTTKEVEADEDRKLYLLSLSLLRYKPLTTGLCRTSSSNKWYIVPVFPKVFNALRITLFFFNYWSQHSTYDPTIGKLVSSTFFYQPSPTGGRRRRTNDDGRRN